MSTSKLIQTAFRFTPRMVSMIKEIQKSQGYSTQAAVVHQAIIEMYNNTFPAYLQNKKNREKPLDPDVVAAMELEQEAARQRASEVKLEGICRALGGEVLNEEGHKSCRYYNYSGKKRYEQTVTLSQLNQNLLQNQYHPSKERVLKLQQDGKVDYEV